MGLGGFAGSSGEPHACELRSLRPEFIDLNSFRLYRAEPVVRVELTRPGIPTQVVVPSVSLAEVLQGTAGTVMVETPSLAVLFNPALDGEGTGSTCPGRTPGATDGSTVPGALTAGSEDT